MSCETPNPLKIAQQTTTRIAITELIVFPLAIADSGFNGGALDLPQRNTGPHTVCAGRPELLRNVIRFPRRAAMALSRRSRSASSSAMIVALSIFGGVLSFCLHIERLVEIVNTNQRKTKAGTKSLNGCAFQVGDFPQDVPDRGCC